jgi:hypothetical protein
MAAAKRNIIIEKGSTFIMDLIWKDSDGIPINLTTYTARMQVRKSYTSDNKLLDLTTENGSIILGGTAGTIHIEGDAEDTAAIAESIKAGVYDLEMVVGPIVIRMLEGDADIRPEVTHD